MDSSASGDRHKVLDQPQPDSNSLQPVDNLQHATRGSVVNPSTMPAVCVSAQLQSECRLNVENNVLFLFHWFCNDFRDDQPKGENVMIVAFYF